MKNTQGLTIKAFGEAMHKLLLLFAFVLIFLSSLAYTYTRTTTSVDVAYAASTSATINFQGRLLNASGSLVPDGYYNIQFNLYHVSSAGSTLWTETHDYNGGSPDRRVRIVNGYFSATLGNYDSLADESDVNWQDDVWLGMTVRGSGACAFAACTPADSEMTPRFKLASVPYALVSANVKSSNTATASTNSDAITIQSGNATGTTSNSGSITVDVGTATQTAGSILIGTTNNTTGITIGKSSGTSATTINSGSGNIILQSQGTSTIGVIQVGAGGVGSASPDYLALDVKSTTGDPAGGAEGYMYYNTFDNKFRCYQGSAWTDCVSSGGAVTLQNAYDNSTNPEIVVDGTRGAFTIRDNGTPIGANLFEVQSNNGATTYFATTATGTTILGNLSQSTGAVSLSGNAASSLTTSSGALTLTSAVATTWSTSAGTLTIQGGGGTVSLGTSTVLNANGTLAINSGTGTALTLDSGTTGAINVGTGANAKTITIGNNTGATSVVVDCGTGACNFGTTATAHTTTIGSSTSTSTTTLQGGTGGVNVGTGGIANTVQIGNATGAVAQTINIGNNATLSSTSTVVIGSTIAGNITLQSAATISIGNNANAQTLNIGNTTGATALNLRAGTGNFTLDGVAGTTYTLGTSTTTGTITIGGTAQTGNLTLGSSSGSNSVLIGNGAGATTVNISNSNTGGAVNIGAGFTTGTITIGGTGAQTGTISIGTGTGAQSLNFGTGGTGAKTVTIGSTASTGTTTIQAGSGGIVLGSGAGQGQLTNHGSTINSTLALSNFAGGGSIGTAATTVDIYTSISVAQTTAGQTLTLPTPTTNTTYGRLLYISNIGTTSFTLLGSAVSVGQSATVIWSNTNGGASWQYSVGATGSTTLQQAYDNSSSPATIALSNSKNLVINAADTATDPSILFNLQTTSTTLGDGSFKIQDAGVDALIFNNDGSLLANNVATGTTGTTSGTGGISVTSIVLAAAGGFANGDIILVDNTGGSGQDYYTRITSGGGTATLTVSPAVSYGTTAGYTGNATITKYTARNIGAVGTGTTFAADNRFFQGYFLGGVVTGSGSTTYSDGRISTSLSSGLRVQNTSDSITALQVVSVAGSAVLDVDTTNRSVGINSASPAARLQVDGTSAANTVISLQVNHKSSTANILEITDEQTTPVTVMQIANGGATTFKAQSNGASTFTVQNASGTSLFNVNSSIGQVRVGNGTNGRITFEPLNAGTNNLWNIDNNAGTLRIFREDYATSGVGINGLVGLSISDAGHTTLGGNLTMTDGLFNVTSSATYLGVFNNTSGGNMAIRISASGTIKSEIAIAASASAWVTGTAINDLVIRTNTSGADIFFAPGAGSGACGAACGNVNIGGGTYKSNLVVTGTGTTCTIGNGTGGTSCTSDSRLKTNVTSLSNSLTKINQLQPVNFNWIDSSNPGNKIGFIAQQVQQIFPEFVSVVNPDDPNQYIGVDYAGLVTPLVGAVQEQQAEIAGIQSQISSINSIINNIQAGNFANINVAGNLTTLNLSVTGTATIANLTVNNNAIFNAGITVAGHIITAGNTPASNVLGASGTSANGATVSVDGNDSSGIITISTASLGALTTGDLAKFTFATPYGISPIVTITPVGSTSATLQAYVSQTATDFTLSTNTAPANGAVYKFNYHVIQ